MERLSYPISVQIELTEACNQKCVHCYNFWRYDSERVNKDELSIDKFLFILEKLNDCGISLITLTGGEPLLRPEVFFALLKQAKKYDMEVGLNSNAVLISKDIAKRMYQEGLDNALISLLGVEKTHNTISNLTNGFKNTCNGITNLIDAGIKVTVNMVASKLNQNEVHQVGQIINDLGVKSFCVTPMVPSHKSHFQYFLSSEECKNVLLSLLKTKDDFNFYIDTLEPIARCMFTKEEEDKFIHFFGNRICSAAVSSCAVSSRGNVRPCIHADKVFGNILVDDLSKIWENMNFWSSPSILPTKCLECNANVICEGGCRMSAKSINGQYNSNTMYMTEPIMDFERINKLSQKRGYNFTNDTLLKINNHIRYRKESFGWVVYNYNNLEFCTESGYEFILNLQKRQAFTLNELVKELGHSEDLIKPVISKLVNNKIISFV